MPAYVYLLKNDGGFSPNPFHSYCTLACCKPQIRRVAKPGDWIIGITPKADGHRLAYAMQVDEVLTFDAYFRDPRFLAKRPRGRGATTRRERCGDNIYEPLADGSFRQLPSAHFDFKNDRENPRLKATDLGGRNVLVARRFSYFGADALPLPKSLSFMLPGRFFRSRFEPAQEAAIVAFISALPRGVRGPPREWNDGSWREGSRCV